MNIYTFIYKRGQIGKFYKRNLYIVGSSNAKKKNQPAHDHQGLCFSSWASKPWMSFSYNNSQPGYAVYTYIYIHCNCECWCACVFKRARIRPHSDQRSQPLVYVTMFLIVDSFIMILIMIRNYYYHCYYCSNFFILSILFWISLYVNDYTLIAIWNRWWWLLW